jgi:hypothetical protein
MSTRDRPGFAIVPYTLPAAELRAPDATQPEGACTYELDAQLRIRAVDTAWEKFAAANDAPELAATSGLLGSSVFAYIADATTAALYRLIFERVRRTQLPLVLPLRCDSPALRRYLSIEISPATEQGLCLRTSVIRLEPRPPVPLLDLRGEHEEPPVRMCGWCKAVDVSGRWCEAEQAVREWRLFERPRLPRISHGICPACYTAVMASLD